MIGFLIISNHIGGQIVPLHHGIIGMAPFALLGVEFPRFCRVFLKRGMINLGVVKAVTIGAGGAILVSPKEGLAVSGGDILFIAVTLRALFDDGALKLFTVNGFDGVNVSVAVPTTKILLDVMEV